MKKSLFVGAFLAACIGFFIEDLVIPALVEARRWTNRSKEVDSYQYDAQGRLVLRSHERRDNQPRGGYYGYSPGPAYYSPPVHRVPRCEDYIGPSHPDYYRVCGGGHGHFPGNGGYDGGVGDILSPELTICLFCTQPSSPPPIIRERVVEERPVILERERVVYRDREVAPALAPTPEPRKNVCPTTCFYVSGGSAEANRAVVAALLDRSYTVLESAHPDAHEVRVADKVVGDPTAIVNLTLVNNGQIKSVVEGRAVYKGGELSKIKAIAKAADEAVGKL